MKKNGYTLIELLVLVLMIVVALILLVKCFGGVLVSEKGALETVTTMGFSEAQALHKGIFFVGWRGCSDSDYAKFEIRAKNPLGKPVNLIVCGGLFKGYTLRSE